MSAPLTGETILCFASDPWSGVWRNRHQIMTRLAQRNTVLYIEPRLYLKETLRRVRAGRLTLADLRRPLAERQPEGLWVYHDPYYAPHALPRRGGRLTAALRRRALKKTVRQHGANAPILWLLRPNQSDQIGQYGEKLVVYHVTDEYSAYPQEPDPAAFLRSEADLLRRADLTIVTSPALLASKSRFSPHVSLVQNAVDYEQFQATLASGRTLPLLDAPAGGRAIPHPRAGYVGALNEKLDTALLAAVARSRPDWQFLVIGYWTFIRQPEKLDLLRGVPNIHLLGATPVDQVPLAIAACDVCILPYEHNAWTANIDSLKLYEYLACGRPIVSSDIPAAAAFGDLIYLADEPATFAAAIETAGGR